MANELRITFDVTSKQAYALAQLCKRIGYSEVRALAVDQNEAQAMLEALDCIRHGLREANITVR
jgi:hypothetical protein